MANRVTKGRLISTVEDEEFSKVEEVFTGIKLDRLSVDSLQDYLNSLHEEISRVNQEIDKKRLLKKEANSFFKINKIE